MKRLFSEQDIRGLLLFLPLAALAVAALLLVQPKPDVEAARQLEATAQAEQEAWEAMNEAERDSLLLARRSFRFQPFDPNTVSYETLLAMGLTRKEAHGLVNYRANGKEFRIPEDVALCYSISDELYQLLKPYIRIDEKYAPTPRRNRYNRRQEPEWEPLRPFRIDTVPVEFFVRTGMLTRRQAEVVVNRQKTYGIYDRSDLRDCRVVSDSIMQLLEPYIRYPEREPDPFDEPVDINRADSAELCRVRGIGAVTAGRIVAYRTQLGGFVSVEQLAEVPGMTERNYEAILKQICCKNCEIQKIDINFADPKIVAQHPYMVQVNLRKLVKTRQLKGGWASAQEMVDDDILKPEQAARLAPYLLFREKGAEPTAN